ncbi:protein YABBY 2-like [Wolffia australiana]
MSFEAPGEKVCYVHCNICNTVLAVSVPFTMMNVITVRCGHCASLLSVSLGGMLQAFPLQDIQSHRLRYPGLGFLNGSSSSKGERTPAISFTENDRSSDLPAHPPEKRQRVPSAYNRFIKEEIQRIKSMNPDISHREAFSAAAKNWAHFPTINFGLNMENNKKEKVDETISLGAASKTQGIH